MIDVLSTTSPGQLEIRMSGRVTQEDYDKVLVPHLEKALTEQDQLRILVVVESDLDGFDMGAVWSDTKMGLAHWRGFDRAAIATDIAWMRVATRAAAPFMPCPVKLFAVSELDDARRWLRESLGTIHVKPLGGPVLQLSLIGSLDPEAYARADEGIAAHIRQGKGFRLLLDLREFDGWQGLSALAAHLKIASHHIGQAERIALVGDKAWQHMAERIGHALLSAQTQFYDTDHYGAAKTWLLSETTAHA